MDQAAGSPYTLYSCCTGPVSPAPQIAITVMHLLRWRLESPWLTVLPAVGREEGTVRNFPALLLGALLHGGAAGLGNGKEAQGVWGAAGNREPRASACLALPPSGAAESRAPFFCSELHINAIGPGAGPVHPPGVQAPVLQSGLQAHTWVGPEKLHSASALRMDARAPTHAMQPLSPLLAAVHMMHVLPLLHARLPGAC